MKEIYFFALDWEAERVSSAIFGVLIVDVLSASVGCLDKPSPSPERSKCLMSAEITPVTYFLSGFINSKAVWQVGKFAESPSLGSDILVFVFNGCLQSS